MKVNPITITLQFDFNLGTRRVDTVITNSKDNHRAYSLVPRNLLLRIQPLLNDILKTQLEKMENEING